MWKIWKEEIFKIASRKIIWLALILLAVFILWRQMAERSHYSVMIGGQVFYGQEAIDKDKELAAEYAGALTEEKVRQIYDAFGFYHYDEQKDVSVGNYCSRFITERMTDYKFIGSEDPEEIHFLQGEEWENNAAPLLKGDIRFDYAYGWNDMRETHSFLTVMALCIVCIIGLSPVFSEEYTMKTANILLTTQRGKRSGIWMKMTAALFLSAAVYCAFSLYIWLIYLAVYGTQGLDASAVLLGVPVQGYHPGSIGGFFLFEFALGLAGIILLASMTMAVSALCKNAFLTVIVSLVVFLIPYAWINVLAVMLSAVLSMELIRTVSHFMTSMPFYLSVNWGFGFAGRQILLHLAIAAAVWAVCMVLGYQKYRNYQG